MWLHDCEKYNSPQKPLVQGDFLTIKVGDKATLTFDAVTDLSISGQVAEIDTVGTVSQGVVSYALKIAFDTQDTRVKPGMTVSAAPRPAARAASRKFWTAGKIDPWLASPHGSSYAAIIRCYQSRANQFQQVAGYRGRPVWHHG